MPISTYLGIVEQGQIRLCEGVSLPENARVYVVLPDSTTPPQAVVRSPRLADPTQAAEFEKQVIEVEADANL